MNRNSFLLFTALILAAAFSRLLPHPDNFTPVGAMALFAGAAFRDRRVGLAVAVTAMLLSDIVIGFHATMWAVYLSFAVSAGIGVLLRNRLRPLTVLGGAVASSLVFFLLTNFAVWAEGLIYPMTAEGLLACYAAGIPFYRNTLAAELFFTAVLFGASYLVLNPFRLLPSHWVRV